MTIHQPAFARTGRAAPRPAVRPAPLFDPNAVGGAYGWLTPYVAAIAASNRGFAARALILPRGEQHFIALAVALMGARADDRDHIAAFARAYGVEPRQRLLAEAAPDANPRLVRLVGKFAGAPWRAPAYRRLAALMDEPHARKTLLHLPRITRWHVSVLARLPLAYRTRSVLKLIKKRRDVSEIVFAIEMVRRVRTDLTDRQILASLEKADLEYIRPWVMRHYERVPFPAAPTGALVLGGVDALRPLTGFDDLARAAREFDNCIRDYLWRVLKSDAYFYRYAPEAGGKGVAIVELRRVPALGWVVHEALGPKNEAVKGADRAAIIAAFRKAGVAAAPQAVSPNAWFELE